MPLREKCRLLPFQRLSLLLFCLCHRASCNYLEKSDNEKICISSHQILKNIYFFNLCLSLSEEFLGQISR